MNAPDPQPFPSRSGLLLMLLAALGLAVLGEAIHACRAGEHRCLLDRLPIQPIYMVRLMMDEGQQEILLFGSPRCALTYLEKNPGKRPASVVLTDEVSGRPVPSQRAWVVRSAVETSRQDGNRLHVFADEIEARRHAQSYDGAIVPDPFAPHVRR